MKPHLEVQGAHIQDVSFLPGLRRGPLWNERSVRVSWPSRVHRTKPVSRKPGSPLRGALHHPKIREDANAVTWETRLSLGGETRFSPRRHRNGRSASMQKVENEKKWKINEEKEEKVHPPLP